MQAHNEVVGATHRTRVEVVVTGRMVYGLFQGVARDSCTRGLAARARAGVEFVLTEDHLDDWMLLAVEGGVGQDVASEKRRRSS